MRRTMLQVAAFAISVGRKLVATPWDQHAMGAPLRKGSRRCDCPLETLGGNDTTRQVERGMEGDRQSVRS